MRRISDIDDMVEDPAPISVDCYMDAMAQAKKVSRSLLLDEECDLSSEVERAILFCVGRELIRNGIVR